MTRTKKGEISVTIPHPKYSNQFLGKVNLPEKLPQSILFTGSKSIGKATFAYQLIEKLIGKRAKILNGSHPDLLTIETNEKGSILVDDIRKMLNFLSLTPAESQYRIVMIDNADDMNKNASNALLKMLEEPPANSFIFLISNLPSSLLPTIRSRCIKIRFQNPNFEDFSAILKSHNIKGDMFFLYELSNGSPGLAMRLYHSNLVGNKEEMLTIINSNNIAKWVEFAEKAAKNPEIWNLVVLFLQKQLLQMAKNGIAKDELFALWDEICSMDNLYNAINLEPRALILQLFSKIQKLSLSYPI